MKRLSSRNAGERLRPAAEQTRVGLRALFRAVDQLGVAQALPPQLRTLMELDADCAEALAVLERPPGGMDWSAMVRDTTASMTRVAQAREALLATLDEPTRAAVETRAAALEKELGRADAYLDIPGARATPR